MASFFIVILLRKVLVLVSVGDFVLIVGKKLKVL